MDINSLIIIWFYILLYIYFKYYVISNNMLYFSIIIFNMSKDGFCDIEIFKIRKN